MRLPARDIDHVLEQTAHLWEEVREGRFLITGGTGFFGTWILETLLAARPDADVTLLTRDAGSFAARRADLAARVHLLEGDVRSFPYPSGEFRFIVHGAAEASAVLNDEQPLVMFDTIVAGTRRVLELAKRARTERMLLMSSGAVYGRQPAHLDRIGEDFAGGPVITDPRSAYAEGKRVAEWLCAVSDVPVTIARCFAFVGPHLPLDRHFAIGNFISDVLAGRDIEIHGDGTPVRSYLYASDLAIWLWTILFRGQPGRPYNVGSEDSMSIADAARQVAAQADGGIAIRIARTAPVGHVPERYVPSTARARQELGLHQRIEIGEAIRRTIAWHRGEV